MKKQANSNVKLDVSERLCIYKQYMACLFLSVEVSPVHSLKE